MLTKSRFAFECSSADLVPNRKGHIYLWTFTFKNVLDLAVARKMWSRFLDEFRRRKFKKFFQGLRVFELHPGGHGLHIHVITTNFIRINEVRATWSKFLGGRIHVMPIAWERRNYVAKYLGKSTRPPCFKGLRLWASFGGFDHTRVKDIEVESDFTRAYKVLVASVAGFARLKWIFRQRAIMNVIQGFPWHRGFVAEKSYALHDIPSPGPVNWSYSFEPKPEPQLW